MNPNMFLPGDWADPTGWVIMMIVLAVILVGLALKMVAGVQWDDWLDERVGRGSIRDWWLLGRNGGPPKN